jgi:uncharacterized protein with HEPN domain
LEIIGEASKNGSSELKSEHINIYWQDVTGMRNFLIHEYFALDFEIVWNTIQNDLPVFKEKIKGLIQQMDGSLHNI